MNTPTPKLLVVFCTVPDMTVASQISEAVLQNASAACVNVIPGIVSHYMWQGKRENSQELLLIFKTQADLYQVLERTIQDNHPYDVPEVIALEVENALEAYAQWVQNSTAAQ